MSMSARLCVKSNTHATGEYKCLSNKTEQSIYECLLGFCFNNILPPPQILAPISTVFSSAQFRNEEMMGDGFLLISLRFFDFHRIC